MVEFQGVGILGILGILEAKTMFDLSWTKQIDWIKALHLGRRCDLWYGIMGGLTLTFRIGSFGWDRIVADEAHITRVTFPTGMAMSLPISRDHP